MDTKLFDAQDALKALLDASVALTDIPKSLGAHPQLSDQDDSVWISGEVDDWNQVYNVSGLTASDEDFVLRVHCVASTAEGYVGTRNRAKSFLAAVSAIVAANPHISGTVTLAKITRLAMEEAVRDERRHAVLITAYISCWTTLVS